jgi:hypothetical protein
MPFILSGCLCRVIPNTDKDPRRQKTSYFQKQIHGAANLINFSNNLNLPNKIVPFKHFRHKFIGTPGILNTPTEGKSGSPELYSMQSESMRENYRNADHSKKMYS